MQKKSDDMFLHSINNRSLTVVVVFFCFLVAYQFFSQLHPVPLKIPLSTFPVSLGYWKGHEMTPEATVFRLKGADHELMRLYRSPSGYEIQLYIGYYEVQEHKKELISYFTNKLHYNASTVSIPGGEQVSVTINQSWMQDKATRHRIYFWYSLNGRIVTSPYKVKYLMVLDRLLHRGTQGGLVLVSVPWVGSENRFDGVSTKPDSELIDFLAQTRMSLLPYSL